jgi:coenzyme F420-0:L-glutamate ligase/coenzyme F420-1:gamma-L-glutamate ligase
VIKGRRSIRRYKETRVENQTLEDILQAALWAPSAHNRQPWRWIILQNEDDRLTLARAMGKALVRTRTADGDDPLAIQKDVERSVERIRQAPVAIVACLDITVLDRYPDSERDHAEYLMAVQSVAMAGQNIMLLAHAEGLGSCWMCAPLFSPASVHEAFEIPEDWIPQGLILLGYPDSQGREPPRKPFKEVVRWI